MTHVRRAPVWLVPVFLCSIGAGAMAAEGVSVAGQAAPTATSTLDKQVNTLQGEVDALQAALAKDERAWYRDPAVVISLLALLFSFGTTAVSYYRTRQQDVHDARAELRTLIQRLGALPRENTELMAKYVEHPLIAAGLSAAVNQENALIAKQAAEVIARIPGYVSATEYLAIANALVASGISEKTAALYERAIAAAHDANDEVNALRTYGAFLFQSGDAGRGRIQFQTALNVFSKYPTRNEYYIGSTHVLTERSWAQAEYGSGGAQEAARHLEKAREYVLRLAPGEFTDQLKGQIREVAKNLNLIIAL